MKFNPNRSFGVEIEFAFCQSKDEAGQLLTLRDELAEIGIQVDPYSHSDSCPEWRLVMDTSCGWELVSPILAGLEGLAEVKKVLDFMAANPKVCVTKECGLHVHHDATGLSPEMAFGLLSLYYLNEPIIDTLVAPWRRGRENDSYADSLERVWKHNGLDVKPLSASDRHALTWDSLLQGSRTFSSDRLVVVNSRYLKVNLRAILLHNTVEFRQLEGTLDSELVLDWIVFTQLFVERAVLGTPITSKTCRDWGNLMRRLQVVGSQCDWDETTLNATHRLGARHRATMQSQTGI